MIRQTILPLKLNLARDLITPHAGLALLGEFAAGLGLLQLVDRSLLTPGSGAGYYPSECIFSLIGKSIVALRSDSAVYQAEIINCSEDNGIRAPGSGRNLRGEGPLPGDARSR